MYFKWQLAKASGSMRCVVVEKNCPQRIKFACCIVFGHDRQDLDIPKWLIQLFGNCFSQFNFQIWISDVSARRTRRIAPHRCEPSLICSKRLSKKKTIFQGLIAQVLFYIETRGSSVLYSPWASENLYTYRKNWIIVSILQYRVTFWNPEIVLRLSKFSKSVDSFCIRCGLGWVFGD